MSSFNLVTEIKLYLIILFIYVSLDLLVKLVLNAKMYTDNINKINDNSGWPSYGKMTGSLIGLYFLLAFGVYHFCVKQNSYVNAIILGTIIYGAYNASNAASITNENSTLAVMDTAWGAVLTLITTIIAILLGGILVPVASAGVGSAAPSAALSPIETTTEIPSGDSD